MTKHVVLLAALAGCDFGIMARHHAPGRADLATPLPHEDGDPNRYEQATEPGSESVMIALLPYIIGGLGRGDDGAGEVGAELRVEYHEDDGRAYLGREALAVTLGAGVVQWSELDPTIAPAALYAELSYRFLAGDTWPLDIGVGPALYTDDVDGGGQVTLRSLLFSVRTRFMATTGLEIMVGYELPIPFFFQRSR